MISKVFNRDVFSTTLQPGEEKIRILCGTNNLGDNSTAPKSVAGQIGNTYSSTFTKFSQGPKSMGDIYKVKGNIDEIPAHFIGIVCNEVEGLITDSERNWKFAPDALIEGLETIYNDDTIIPSSEKVLRLAGRAKLDIENLSAPTQKYNALNSIEKISGVIDRYRNTLNPILRTVMIGAGRSGQENDANVAKILRVMQESENNLHLYVQQEMANQVANVVQLFPELNNGALAEYTEIRLVD